MSTNITTDAAKSRSRSAELRTAILLTYITLTWMTIEGAASLILGWASKSLLLESFGIDSEVELFSAGVLLWRLKIEFTGKADEQRIESVERRAALLVGYSLYVLRRMSLACPHMDCSSPRAIRTRMRASGEL